MLLVRATPASWAETRGARQCRPANSASRNAAVWTPFRIRGQDRIATSTLAHRCARGGVRKWSVHDSLFVRLVACPGAFLRWPRCGAPAMRPHLLITEACPLQKSGPVYETGRVNGFRETSTLTIVLSQKLHRRVWQSKRVPTLLVQNEHEVGCW